MVKVSIIMPSLNVRLYIRECLQSARNQTLKDIEMICIDAGSTDGTWEYLQDVAKEDTRVKLLHSDIKSYGVQVNLGIKIAQGNYIAILETDDYVSLDMYEKLYEIAEREGVDYVKADYTNFYTLKNGRRILNAVKLFEDKPYLYNTVINPHNEDEIYKKDFSLWKGIYRKSFLIDNNIFLNESPGAAFQDIGFKELVLLYAKSAYYSDGLFYYYRMDREEASTYSVDVLKYTWVEFNRFIDLFEDKCEQIYLKGLYMYMVISFCEQYKRTLIKLDYDCSAKECSGYYEWFRDKIQYALDKKIISIEDFDVNIKKELPILLYDVKRYSELLSDSEKTMKNRFEYIRSKVRDKDLIIFGAGHWGREVLKDFDKNNMSERILSFTDNDLKKVGKDIAGIHIYSINMCIDKYHNAVYLITNEKNHHEIEMQLERLEIPKEQIIDMFK